MGNDKVKEIQFEPFNKIGLCFSGGGYRATFFTLGILSYLDAISYKNKSLLKSVKALSTVSGGTLTGVAFAKALQEKDFDFKTFFKTFYNTFTPTNDVLLKSAVRKLSDDNIWKTNSHKNRSLINAFALTYSEMPLFKGAFDSFREESIHQLENVCFNATDFSFGLTYRFQNKGYFGNNPLFKYNQSAINALKNQIQLGDVIASSSCFPVGFEPMVFPDDYIKIRDDKAYKELKKSDLFKNGVGIMDGGITDNQGIGSMVLINNRMKNTDNGALDLIIVNDVGSYKMNPWEPDTRKIESNSTLQQAIDKILKYFSFKLIYVLILFTGILIITLNFLNVFGEKASSNISVIGGFITGFGVLVTVLGYIVSKIKALQLSKLNTLFNKNVPEPIVDDVMSFKNLDISLIKVMISNRISSSMTMINDVFLKQIRRINYDYFYSKSEYKNKRITATIYKLNGVETPYNKNTDYNQDIKPFPSDELKNISLIASKTPTTLWWDQNDIDNNRMESLIACGQFTICYELLEYILELKADKESGISDFKEINKLESVLKTQWQAFNKNPLWLVNDLK
ncbi:patatin-like phospholipase family protein [uncultured Winogradskyella sp.]|uniref:patatin-like phospholipase family protein n=1 Tax=Winogradskyella sp. 4-2091 TaxID=3381659 RepID=UPI0026272D46|nr:patatin-like phospholipase family protein [uncultured Winogradskyella sp.]